LLRKYKSARYFQAALFLKLISPHMVEHQNELSESHRFIVVDHLLHMCVQNRLRDESFFMAVEMMDAHLSSTPTKLCEIELIAITSLFVATKYEEVQPIFDNVGRFTRLPWTAC
jgi:hypothetical protein